MDTKGFFDFYYALYAKGGDDVVINSMFRRKGGVRKLFFDITKKREVCEACIFTCFLENDKFKEQLLIYENIFKETIERYKTSHWFNEDFGKEEKTLEYYARKYHEIRKRQIELVLKFIEKVKNPRITNPTVSSELCVENVTPHFEGYSVETMTAVFEYLISNRYLDAHTSKEDFIYYFTGEGEIPTNRLKWCAKKVYSTIFIETLFGEVKNKWDITSYIFDEIKDYSNIYSKKFRTGFTDKESEFVKVLKDITKSATH